jgi:hypothetical protein
MNPHDYIKYHVCVAENVHKKNCHHLTNSDMIFLTYLFIYLSVYLVIPFVFIFYSLGGLIFINLIDDTSSILD